MQNILTINSFYFGCEYCKKTSIKILKSADNEIPIIFFLIRYLSRRKLYTQYFYKNPFQLRFVYIYQVKVQVFVSGNTHIKY